MGMGIGGGEGMGHARKGSAFSLVSEASEDGDGDGDGSVPASPALMMAALPEEDIVSPISPISPDKDSPSLGNNTNKIGDEGRGKENTEKGNKEKEVRKHRYTVSADSISYMKEDDPVVGERWVLERRRTAETGEVEILEREVVSGWRI